MPNLTNLNTLSSEDNTIVTASWFALIWREPYPTSNAESWCWMVLWSPTRPSTTNAKIRCPFPHRELEYKWRKSRDIWSHRQVWPWSTKWSRTKANRVLPTECTGQSKHPVRTTHKKTLYMDITRWSIPKYLIIFFAAKDGEALYSQKNKTGSWLWLWSWTPYYQIQTEIEESRENH